MALIVSVLMPQAGQSGSESGLEPGQVAGMMKSANSNGYLTLLDLRTPGEHKRGHISGSVNVDFHGPSFREAIKKFPKNELYIVYCATGIRSTAGLQIMKNMGFGKVFELTGGIFGWKKAGFEVKNEESLQNGSTEICPVVSFNKVNKTLTIKNGNDPVRFIRGINMNGKQVFVRNIENNRTEITGIPTGSYILLMETGNGEKHTCSVDI